MEENQRSHHCSRPGRCFVCIALVEQQQLAKAHKEAPDYVRSLLGRARKVCEAQNLYLKYSDRDVNQIYLDALTKGCEALTVAFDPVDTSAFSG